MALFGTILHPIPGAKLNGFALPHHLTDLTSGHPQTPPPKNGTGLAPPPESISETEHGIQPFLTRFPTIFNFIFLVADRRKLTAILHLCANGIPLGHFSICNLHFASCILSHPALTTPGIVVFL